MTGAEGAAEASGLVGVEGATSEGGFRRDIGLLVLAGAAGLDGIISEKVFEGPAGAPGATGASAARLGGASLEDGTRGGTAVRNLGRANGERLTGGWNGANSGGVSLSTRGDGREGRTNCWRGSKSGAAGSPVGSGGRNGCASGLGEASTGALGIESGNCSSRRSA